MPVRGAITVEAAAATPNSKRMSRRVMQTGMALPEPASGRRATRFEHQHWHRLGRAEGDWPCPLRPTYDRLARVGHDDAPRIFARHLDLEAGD